VPQKELPKAVSHLGRRIALKEKAEGRAWRLGLSPLGIGWGNAPHGVPGQKNDHGGALGIVMKRKKNFVATRKLGGVYS